MRVSYCKIKSASNWKNSLVTLKASLCPFHSSLPTPAKFIHHDLELTFVSETTVCTFDTLFFLFIFSSVFPPFLYHPGTLAFCVFFSELSEKSTADMLPWRFKVKSAQLDIEETDGCKDRVGRSAIITHCPPRTARSEANTEQNR